MGLVSVFDVIIYQKDIKWVLCLCMMLKYIKMISNWTFVCVRCNYISKGYQLGLVSVYDVIIYQKDINWDLCLCMM
jgi:hypothetical protein